MHVHQNIGSFSNPAKMKLHLTELVFMPVWNLISVWVHFASHVKILIVFNSTALYRKWYIVYLYIFNISSTTRRPLAFSVNQLNWKERQYLSTNNILRMSIKISSRFEMQPKWNLIWTELVFTSVWILSQYEFISFLMWSYSSTCFLKWVLYNICQIFEKYQWKSCFRLNILKNPITSISQDFAKTISCFTICRILRTLILRNFFHKSMQHAPQLLKVTLFSLQ